MVDKIRVRRGTAAQVPTLDVAEPGYDTDTKTFRVGDGTSTPPRTPTTKATGNFDFTNGGANTTSIFKFPNVELHNALPVAQGGHGATSVINARNNLGIRVGDNRIINGRMEIDQRNNGAAVTVSSTSQNWSVDRFFGSGQFTDGVFSLQRLVGGPPGFVNYLRATTTTADASIGAAQYYVIGHLVEGINIQDLAWGTANAQTVTLRFAVRSTLTGTFSGSIRNNAGDRGYPFSFVINSANTWEFKTVTIPSDTTGTWLTDTSIGIRLIFDLGSGSNNRGSAGTWIVGAGAASLFGVTGAVSLISTLNATFDITGVELVAAATDIGPTWRPFYEELFMCQRYLQQARTAILGIAGSGGINVGARFMFKPQMRGTPSLPANTAGNTNTGTTVTDGISSEGFRFYGTLSASGAYEVNYVALASSEL